LIHGRLKSARKVCKEYRHPVSSPAIQSNALSTLKANLQSSHHLAAGLRTLAALLGTANHLGLIGKLFALFCALLTGFDARFANDLGHWALTRADAARRGTNLRTIFAVLHAGRV
jgi:hypothetical protein